MLGHKFVTNYVDIAREGIAICIAHQMDYWIADLAATATEGLFELGDHS